MTCSWDCVFFYIVDFCSALLCLLSARSQKITGIKVTGINCHCSYAGNAALQPLSCASKIPGTLSSILRPTGRALAHPRNRRGLAPRENSRNSRLERHLYRASSRFVIPLLECWSCGVMNCQCSSTPTGDYTICGDARHRIGYESSPLSLSFPSIAPTPAAAL